LLSGSKVVLGYNLRLAVVNNSVIGASFIYWRQGGAGCHGKLICEPVLMSSDRQAAKRAQALGQTYLTEG
jgi:hypothetical protein